MSNVNKVSRQNQKLITFAERYSGSILDYPQRTVAGMYQQEQELAKADEAGLILTAADLTDTIICPVCCKPECEGSCEFE